MLSRLNMKYGFNGIGVNGGINQQQQKQVMVSSIISPNEEAPQHKELKIIDSLTNERKLANNRTVTNSNINISNTNNNNTKRFNKYPLICCI